MNNGISFNLEILPVGVNHAYSDNRNGRRFLTSIGREYKEAIGWAARENNPQGILFKKPSVHIIYTYPDHRRRDIDSGIKLTLDALNGVLWDDDSQVVELHVLKRFARNRPSISITVQEYEE